MSDLLQAMSKRTGGRRGRRSPAKEKKKIQTSGKRKVAPIKAVMVLGDDDLEQENEVMVLRAKVARLEKELASARRGLAQSKRERVYHLPGGKQLLKWVQKCKNWDAVSHDACKHTNRSYVNQQLSRLLEGAQVHMAQLGGDPIAFHLSVTLTGVTRSHTFIADEWNHDNPYEYGQELEEELEPYQLRIMMGQGLTLRLPGLPSGRSRYVWAYEDANVYIPSQSPSEEEDEEVDEPPSSEEEMEDEGKPKRPYLGVFHDVSREEFRIVRPEMLHLIVAHCLQFLPKRTRDAYFEGLPPNSILARCMGTCGCFSK